MAATVHFFASIANGGYYEADVAKENLFRHELTTGAQLDQDDSAELRVLAPT